MKRLLFLTAFGALAACSAGTPSPANVEVADAACRPAAPGRDVTGCYVTLTASRNDRLLSAASPSARDLQIHEMKSANGMMRMSELPDGLPLPAGEAVHLAPGGNHIMLLGATGSLAAGGIVPVTLTFEHARAQQVTFRIAQPSTGEHGGH